VTEDEPSTMMPPPATAMLFASVLCITCTAAESSMPPPTSALLWSSLSSCYSFRPGNGRPRPAPGRITRVTPASLSLWLPRRHAAAG
jgi:hypothetical protein